MASHNQFNATAERCNNCLYLVRQLRSRVLKTHQHIFTEVGVGTDPTYEQVYLCEKLLDKLRIEFDTLENYAKVLPGQLPNIDKLDRMKNVFQEEQVDQPTHDLVNALVDSSNWNEGNFQMYGFLSDFQRNTRKKPSAMIPRPMAYTNWTTAPIHPHTFFEQSFVQVQKEFQSKKVGIFPTYLERNSMSSIVEVKFGVFSDKQFVCTLKMILVENCGQVDMIQFVAPLEEWTFNEVLGERRVDLTKPSKYLVFRKLTTQGNLHLMQLLNPHMDIRTSQYLLQLCYIFSKFQQVFEAKCRACQKVMRDFLPPLIFNFQHPKNAAMHESCKM